MPESPSPYAARLQSLRAAVKKRGADGFIVPRADEYQGEFCAAYAERLAWLTGFTGSAGIALVLPDRASVLTDGRYTIQLRRQIDPALFEPGDMTKRSAGEWLAENASQGTVIGFDPWLHTPEQVRAMEGRLEGTGVTLKALETNPLDEIWAEDRPGRPDGKVEGFPEEIAGRGAAEKLALVAEALKKEKADALLLTLPDSVCWLLNVRGDDVPCTPLVLSYALYVRDGGTLHWFVEPERVPRAVRDTLGEAVEIRPPERLRESLAALGGKSVMLDERRAPLALKTALEEAGATVLGRRDPCILPKACKTDAEQKAIEAAHVRDGAAVVKFLCWLEREAETGALTEMAVAEKLESFRARRNLYRGPSFPTIAGFGANGAVIHYRANESTNARIAPPGLLLIDSGGQYPDGTTDITRTVAVGEPSEEMRTHFTLVLKGHIGLARARFPEGTTGMQLDALARQPLWNKGLDYAHGTGHGVGCYLGVHEEAASISPRGRDPLKPGMLLSNEPGYYRENAYGIRIENLVFVEEAGEEAFEGTGTKMLQFRTVTLAPIDRRLIAADMLTRGERDWLNDYHAKVWEALQGLLEPEERDWLRAQTEEV